MKTKQKGFIVTQTMFIILTILSFILGSNSFTDVQKEEMKNQTISLIEKEIASQIIVTEEEPVYIPVTETEKKVIDHSVAEKYYADVDFSQHGKGLQTLPNEINYTVNNNDYFGFWASGLEISFENKWNFPVAWLIEKNYVPESINDLPRMRKVFMCEYRLYLGTINMFDWEKGDKDACEYFLKITPEEQYQYNLDYRDETGKSYF